MAGPVASKADTLALINTLSSGLADPTLAGFYYDDAMYSLAAENWTCDAAVTAVQIGQTEVDFSSTNFVNLLGLVYDDLEMEEIPLRQLEMLDPNWRDALGSTMSYTVEDVDAKSVALYPAPRLASNPLGGTYGEPLGGDYAVNNTILFYSYPPLTPLVPPYYLELLVALRVIMREFSRESDHADPSVVGLAAMFNQMFVEMLQT